MISNNMAIKVENISKRYRIGLKEKIHDSVGSAIFDIIKSPLKNYRKYRSLYKFDNIEPPQDYDPNNNVSDIVWALREVSFEVKQGEAIGIIGRNGAGKSTLLKILTKVTDPTSGRAEIHGRVSSLLEVGTGFHQELSGRENVYLNGTILGMRKKEVDRKFDQIVDFSGVEKFINTPVKRYSSGMRVRLAFSVAAHLEPEVLLIDEVLAVGDVDFQKKCLNKMEEVGKEGRTVLFVSHNMPAVTRLCNRAILLDNGRVIKDGPCDQIVSSYLNSDLGTSAAREWLDPATAPTGDIARLNAVRVRTDDCQIGDTIDIRRSFTVEMEYEVVKGGSVLLPVFAFDNKDGLRVFTTVDLDPTWRQQPRPEGHYVSTVHIPGNLLTEGVLFVTSTLLTVNPDGVQFMERTAVAFQVTDSLDGDSARGDYSRNIPGVVRPMLRWTTQFNPVLDETATDGL